MRTFNHGYSWSVCVDMSGNWGAVHKKTNEIVPCNDENQAIELMHSLHFQDSDSPE
jgi:hypothetical protein